MALSIPNGTAKTKHLKSNTVNKKNTKIALRRDIFQAKLFSGNLCKVKILQFPYRVVVNAVLRIRFILIWIRIRILLQIRPKIGKISTFGLLFFSIKNTFLRNMICFVIYGVNIYVSKHKFNSFEKKCIIFLWFSWKFSMISADFLLPGSGSVSLKRIRIRLTKIKRIQTDPDLDPQHCLNDLFFYLYTCKN